jgi:gliding motility-associated lipoprotein GldD
MRFALAFGLLIAFFACKTEEIPDPKPRIYPKVEYPQRKMTSLSKDFCSFTFEYPDYMQFELDTLLINQPSKHPCWFTLRFPSLNGTIHFTYTPLKRDSLQETLYKVYRDAYKLAEEHNRKANSNEDLIISNPKERVYGVLFNIEGHVASPFQFVLTDSSRHAVRASLYFDSRPNPDSMKPVINFLKEDMIHVVNTFKWVE